MKLLKYPIGGTCRGFSALESVSERLIVGGRDGHVTVWLQADIGRTALNEAGIEDLKCEFEFQVGVDGSEVHLKFLVGDESRLFVGMDHEVVCYENWISRCSGSGTPEHRSVVKLSASCFVTDVKYDMVSKLLFISTTNDSKVMIFDAQSLKMISSIELDKTVRPITIVLDPTGRTLNVYCLDRSILVYQVNSLGNYKLIQKLTQQTQLYPLSYRISMPPQGNWLPVLNSIKGAGSTVSNSTLLLDRNDNYKVSTTLVTPPYVRSHVLKFSPAVYEKVNTKKNTKARYNLLATSGEVEGSIIIWNTKRVKPLFNALKVSETSINDMVWSNDGMMLFAISDDNVLYNFAFQPNDLGEKISKSELEKLQMMNKQLPELVEEKPAAVKTEDSEVVKTEPTKTKSSTPNGTNSSTVGNNNASNGKPAIKKLNSKSLKQTLDTTQSTSMEFNGPSYMVPKDLKRKPKEDANGELNNKKVKKELEHMDFLDTSLILPNISFSRIRLATPKIRLSFEFSPLSNKSLAMEIQNGSGNEQNLTMVTLKSNALEKGKILFKEFIPKFVTMCAAGSFFWACATEDGYIYVYSDSGKRLFPPLILGVPCSFLEACSKYLLCVTCMGQVYCWDIEAEKLKFPVNSIFPLLKPSLRYSDDVLTRAENITMCSLSATGVPIVTLSNGDGYMFDKDMEIWLLISDGWWAYGSQYWDSTNTTGLNNPSFINTAEKGSLSGTNELMHNIKNDSKSILNFIERKTNDELNRKGRIKNLQRFARTTLMKEGFENIEEVVTLAHLENKILITLRLDETEEFAKLLVVYCIRLSELGYTDRLDEVLQWLYNGGDIETEKLAGKTRKELLKDVLVGCADIRHIQRVTTSYASAIGLIQEKKFV